MKSKSTVVARVAAQRAAMVSRRRTFNYVRLVTARSNGLARVSKTVIVYNVSYGPTYKTVQKSLTEFFRLASFAGCALTGILPVRQLKPVTPTKGSEAVAALLRKSHRSLCDGRCGVNSGCSSCNLGFQGESYGGTE